MCEGDVSFVRWLGGSHGKVEFWFVSRVQMRKGKSQDWKSQSGTFQFARCFLSSHTRRNSSLSRQQIRHGHLRYHLLVRLMHSCCFCCISGRRNGRRLSLVLSWRCDVCVYGAVRRRSPFLFGPFFFDSIFITNGKSRPFRVSSSTRFSNHVGDERMALVVVREHTASDGRCTREMRGCFYG